MIRALTLAALLAIPLIGQAPIESSLAYKPIQDKYDARIKALQNEHRKLVQAVVAKKNKKLWEYPAKYKEALEAHKQILETIAAEIRRGGDLDSALAMKQEIELVGKGTLGNAALLPKPAQAEREKFLKIIGQLEATLQKEPQTAYEKEIQILRADYDTKAKEVHKVYIADLEALVKAETAADRLDSALVVRNRLSSVREYASRFDEILPEGTAFGGNEKVAGYSCRQPKYRKAMLTANGGNDANDAAVVKGLAWLARQQRDNGSWVYDEGTSAQDVCSSTAMALLPFLGAGYTHKSFEGNIHQKTVDKGLKYLIGLQIQPAGSFRTSSNMYSHGLAALALCELYGMTGDKNVLYPAKLAVEYIVKGQGANGSWGYKAGTEGDTSIVGWQVMALKSAQLSNVIVVPKTTLEKANRFLDSVTSKTTKMSTYGYRDGPGARGTALTASGLLSRTTLGWKPDHEAIADGVDGLIAVSSPNKARNNLYYYFFASQIVFARGGDNWKEKWNPKMRAMLLELQTNDGKFEGSWSKDSGMIGSHCGRLGSTCMSLLILETPYRHPLAELTAAAKR